MTKTIGAKRNHKDTVFRMLFNDPKELLELYNGVNGAAVLANEYIYKVAGTAFFPDKIRRKKMDYVY